MPSFDIVSKLDMQEVENAIFNASKEITQRYDFKGSNTNISRSENILSVETEDELKAKQVNELLIGHFVKRGIDPKALEIKSTESVSGNRVKQSYTLLEGIEQDTSKKIIGSVKQSKLKVQVKIQGNELRVSGPKRDNLQEVISLTKKLDLPLPLQFINFRD
jgi:hypothetical protein